MLTIDILNITLDINCRIGKFIKYQYGTIIHLIFSNLYSTNNLRWQTSRHKLKIKFFAYLQSGYQFHIRALDIYVLSRFFFRLNSTDFINLN